MSDQIRMDYELMDNMRQAFLQGVEQLQDTMQEMQSIANTLEDGALLGQGGDAFTDAIRGQLCPAISRLTERLDSLAIRVEQAKTEMQEADQSEASPRFG
jgi:WXG100 family type VII secretion target